MLFQVTFIILLVLSVFIEATIFPFPLVVLFSFFYFIFYDEAATFFVIFLTSILLDIFILNGAGHTAAFLFLFFIILIVIEKIFTIRFSAPIIALAAVVAVEGYRQYAQYPFLFGPEIVFFLGLSFFIIVERRISRRGKQAYET